MDRTEFRETLLGFLNDVTHLPKKNDAGLTLLRSFLSLDFAPDGYRVLNDYVLIKEGKLGDRKEYMIRIELFTENYAYHIIAVHRNVPKSYLGCTVTSRKARAGEEWNRGNDLPDGDFSRETWIKIKDAIIRNELRALSDYLTGGHYIPESERLKKEDVVEVPVK